MSTREKMPRWDPDSLLNEIRRGTTRRITVEHLSQLRDADSMVEELITDIDSCSKEREENARGETDGVLERNVLRIIDQK